MEKLDEDYFESLDELLRMLDRQSALLRQQMDVLTNDLIVLERQSVEVWTAMSNAMRRFDSANGSDRRTH